MDLDKVAKKMDRLKNGVRYTLTINPDDNYQFHVGMNRWAAVRMYVMKEISQYAPQIDTLVLYPDISFPQALRSGVYPRIHFHGWVVFKDIINILTKWEPRSHLSVEIDTISDFEIWKKYCSKFTDIYGDKEMFKITLDQLVDKRISSWVVDKRNIVEMCKEHTNSDSSDSSTSSDSDSE